MTGARLVRESGLLLCAVVALAMVAAITILRPYQFASTDVATFYQLDGVALKVLLTIAGCLATSAALVAPIMRLGARRLPRSRLDPLRRTAFGLAVVLVVFSLGDFLLAQIAFFITPIGSLPPGAAVGQPNWLFTIEWVSILVALVVGIVLSVVISIRARHGTRS